MAKSNSKKSEEVIVLEAEEMPLEQVIDNTLVKQNVTQAVIDGLKKRYGRLRLKSLTDKESYLELKAAKKEVRGVGILVEKICKKGREDAVAIQKKWIGKENELLEKIAVVQDPLDAEIQRFDDEQERLEKEESMRKENAFMQRQSTLLKMGAVYANGVITLGDISYDTDTIKQLDDEIWAETLLPKYTRIYERMEADRIAEQERKDAEAKRLREDQEKLDREKRELERQREEMRIQREEHEQWKREQQTEKDRAEQAERDRINEEHAKKRRERTAARYDQLHALGMRFNGQYDCYAYEDVNVDNKTEINLFNDVEWSALIEKITPVIAQRKAAAEEKRLAEAEAEKKRIADEAVRQEQLRAEKERQDLEAKRIREEQEEQDRITQANDKTKWLHVINLIEGITFPEMKSPSYKAKVQSAKNLIEKIKFL